MRSLGGRIKSREERPFEGFNKARYKGVRLGRVSTVYNEGDFAGTIDVEFLDGSGGRKHVKVTQGSRESYDMPNIGDVILLGFDVNQVCYMLGYIPVGFPNKVEVDSDTGGSELPKVSPGDKISRGKLGQGVYIQEDGSILLDNGRGSYFKLKYADDTIETNSVDYDIETEAGTLHFGVVKRNVTDTLTGETTSEYLNQNGNVFSSVDDDVLTEFVLKIADKADLDPNTASPISNPVVELRFGNIVDDDGVYDQNKQAEILLRNDDGNIKSRLTMSKDGEITLYASEVNLGLSSNKTGAVKFDKFSDVIQRLADVIQTHTHPSLNSPMTPDTRLSNLELDTCESDIVRID